MRVSLQRFAQASAHDLEALQQQQHTTREFLADVSARIDGCTAAHHAFISQSLWCRLRWLVTGV